jgi:hypothetical protein
LGIDPGRIAAAGGSAGGHLAAATAVAPEENPPGTVSGKANLLVLFNPALFYPSAGKTVTLEQFTKDTPPAILFYGTRDEMLQYGKDCLAQARRLGFPCNFLRPRTRATASSTTSPGGIARFGRPTSSWPSTATSKVLRLWCRAPANGSLTR